MDKAESSRRIFRSIGAVLAGIVVGVVLEVGTDLLMHATHIFPPVGVVMSNALFGLAFAYRIIFGVVASYVTARLAPYRPMAHALAGGVLGLIVCIIGAVTTWNRGPEFGPHWYPLALAFTALPTAWLGGKLYEMRKQDSGAVTRMGAEFGG